MKAALTQILSCSALSLIALSSHATTTLTYNINNSANTFQGLGSMIWNSLTDTQVTQLQAMMDDAPSHRLIRINHETRTYNPTLCGTGVPTEYAYADYVTYWANCGDAGLTGARSIEPTSGELTYVWLSSIPASFKDSSNCLLTSRLQDYANYVAAGAHHFSTKYMDKSNNPKYPHYIELVNEPDGNWSTCVTTTNYNNLVPLTAQALTNDPTYVAGRVNLIGPGVSKINWSNGDTYTNALGSTSVADLGEWSVHAWIQDNGVSENTNTGQAALLLNGNWPGWAKGVKNKSASKPIMVTEYATFANKFYYGQSTYVKFAAPTAGLTTSAAYSVPFATRIYNNTIELLAANVGPSSTGASPVAPFGASSALFWQADDQSWQTGGGVVLVDPATNFGSMPQILTPNYKSLSPIYKYVPIGSRILFANTYQNPSSDVFSAAFYDPISNCATVAIVNGTYTDRNGTRITKIAGLPTNSTATLVASKRFRQGCFSDMSTCPFEDVLEDVAISWSHTNGVTTFTTPTTQGGYGMPKHSHLTTQFCYH